MLFSLHYLPSIHYFALLSQFENVQIEAHENYQKQSLRNRTYILTANKVSMLSVPVLASSKHQLINEVEISYAENWQQIHWRSIYSAYKKAPFFEFYADDFEKLFQNKTQFLFDWNWQMMSICLKYLQLNRQIDRTNNYEKQIELPTIDFRSTFNSQKTPFNVEKPYIQVFGNGFVNNLSILDLLFCEGTNAKPYLQEIGKKIYSQIIENTNPKIS